MTTFFTQSIIDNKLLRKITRKGHYEKYVVYWSEVTKLKLINENTQLFITAAGTLEFLSQSLPAVGISDPKYFHDKSASIISQEREKINYEVIQTLRGELLTEIENNLKYEGIYSKAKISKWIGEQRVYTDEQLQDMVFGIIRNNLKNNGGRSFLRNRVALDRSLLFKWSTEFEEWLFPAYLMDLHHAYEMGIGYGSMRGLEMVWKNFCKELRSKIRERRQKLKNATPEEKQEIKKEQFLGKLSLEQIEENIEAITRAAGFAETGDFLDVEAIHYLAVGRFRTEICEPVIFATQDPVDKFLVRVGLFRSLYRLSYQMLKKDDEAIPPEHPGVALIFNDQIKVTYLIPISELDPLLSKSGDIALADWLVEMKAKFAI